MTFGKGTSGQPGYGGACVLFVGLFHGVPEFSGAGWCRRCPAITARAETDEGRWLQ